MYKPTIGRYTFYHPVHGHLLGVIKQQPVWSLSDGDLRRKMNSFDQHFYPDEQSNIMTRFQDLVTDSEHYDGLILRYEYPNSDEFVFIDPMPKAHRRKLIAARRLDHLENPFVFNDIHIGSRTHYYKLFDDLHDLNTDSWQNVMYAKRGAVIKQQAGYILGLVRTPGYQFDFIVEDLFNEVFSDIEDPIKPILRRANLLVFGSRESMMVYRLGVTELDFGIIDMKAFFDQIDADLETLFKDLKVIHGVGVFPGSTRNIAQVR